MASLASLVVSLTAQTAQFENSLRRASNEAGRHMGEIRNSVDRVNQTFGLAKKAVGAFAAAFAIRGFSSFAKDALDAATNAGFFAKQIGASTQGLTELQYAVGTYNIAAQSFNTALQRQTRRIAEAAQGSGVAANAIRELGLSAEKLNTLKADEQFLVLAEAMGNVENQADRVRLAFKLWDKGGVELLRTMESGSGELEQLSARARELGAAFDDEAAAGAAAATGNIADLEHATRALSRQFAISLGPAIAEAAVWMTNTLIPAIASVIQFAKDAYNAIGGLINRFRDLNKLGLSQIDQQIKNTQQELIGLNKQLEIAGKTSTRDIVANRLGGELNTDKIKADIAALTGQLQELGQRKVELEKTANAVTEVGNAADASAAPVRTMGFELSDTEKAAAKAGGSLKKVKKDTEEAITPIEALTRSIRLQARTLEGEASQAYLDHIERLEDEYQQLTLTDEQYQRLRLSMQGITGVQADYILSLEQQNQALKDTRAQAEQLTETQADWLNQVGSAFDKLWSDAISGTKSAMDAIGETIKAGLLSIVQTVLKNRIVIPISAALLGISGEAVSSATGGASSGFSLNQLLGGFDVGGLLAAGGEFLTPLGGNPFANALNVPNWQFGLSGLLGGFAGQQLFGGQGGLGGSIGGTIGAAFGPLGAIAGALLGGFVGGLFGNDKPSNRPAFGSIDLSTLATTTGQFTGKKAPSEETLQVRDTFLQAISGLVQGIQSLGGAASGIVSLDIGQREGVQANFGQGLEQFGKDAEAALDEIFERILEDAEGLSEPFKTLIQFAEGAEEKLQQIQALGALDEILNADPFEAYSQAVEAAGRSVWEAAIQQRDALLDLTSAYDGSVTATQELAQSVQGGYQSLLQLIAVIDQLSQQVSQSFAASIENIQLAILDTEERYDFYRQKAEEAFVALQNAVDPAEIAKASQEFEKYVNAAFGLIPEDQQAEVADQFIQAFETAEAVAQKGFEEARETAKQQALDIKQAIEEALLNAAAAQQRAADTQQQAAQTNLQAAQTPQTIVVDLEGAEVGF